MEINPSQITIKKEPDIDIVVQKPKVSRLEDSVFGEFN